MKEEHVGKILSNSVVSLATTTASSTTSCVWVCVIACSGTSKADKSSAGHPTFFHNPVYLDTVKVVSDRF